MTYSPNSCAWLDNSNRQIRLVDMTILAHVMSMSRLRLAPKVGHIEMMKIIYCYLSRTKHNALRFRTDEINYMNHPDLEYDWTTIYGDVLEEIPKDALNLLENQ